MKLRGANHLNTVNELLTWIVEAADFAAEGCNEKGHSSVGGRNANIRKFQA